MTIGSVQLGHVNVTVPSSLEAAARHFYGEVLGLKQLPKPPGPRQNVGAWYELGNVQLHLSVERGADGNPSNRHVCYLVSSLEKAEQHFRSFEVEIIPDDQPNNRRFYVRDPAGNLLEIAEG